MYQKVILVGNLGKDPEARYSPQGTMVTNFNMATSESYTDRDGNRQENTTWWRVAVWGKSAEACNQYLKKGSKVLVEGTMSQDKSTGGPKVWMSQEGKANASYELRATSVKFLSSGTKNENQETQVVEEEVKEADIPF